MRFHRDDPKTWGGFRPTIIAHDVGRSRDRSTAVIGGKSPFVSDLIGISEFEELPQGLFGSARASALAAVDRRQNCDALIVADLSSDESYAEPLFDTFGSRVIGLHISRHGDGQHPERRPVRHGSMLVYTIGRTYLLELLHSELHSGSVRLVDNPMARRAYEQLANLETEMRESGMVYTCPPGQHDDLGISCAMLVWAARHPHLPSWMNEGLRPRYPKRAQRTAGWRAFT